MYICIGNDIAGENPSSFKFSSLVLIGDEKFFDVALFFSFPVYMILHLIGTIVSFYYIVCILAPRSYSVVKTVWIRVKQSLIGGSTKIMFELYIVKKIVFQGSMRYVYIIDVDSEPTASLSALRRFPSSTTTSF